MSEILREICDISTVRNHKRRSILANILGPVMALWSMTGWGPVCCDFRFWKASGCQNGTAPQRGSAMVGFFRWEPLDLFRFRGDFCRVRHCSNSDLFFHAVADFRVSTSEVRIANIAICATPVKSNDVGR